MPLCKTNPDFKSELFEKVKVDVKAACNAKFAVFKYYLPLLLLLFDNSITIYLAVGHPCPCLRPSPLSI